MGTTISLPEDQDSGLPFYAARVKNHTHLPFTPTTATQDAGRSQIRLRHTRNPAIPRLQKIVRRVLSHHTPVRAERPFDNLHDEEHKHILTIQRTKHSPLYNPQVAPSSSPSYPNATPSPTPTTNAAGNSSVAADTSNSWTAGLNLAF